MASADHATRDIVLAAVSATNYPAAIGDQTTRVHLASGIDVPNYGDIRGTAVRLFDEQGARLIEGGIAGCVASDQCLTKC